MPFDKFLHGLLEQPFGPYLEERVLGDKCKYTASKRLLLDNFQLAYNDEPTGFDRTEFEGLLTPSNAAHMSPIPSGSPVLFRGILLLHGLAHLSEEGQSYLDHDFKERVLQSLMNGVLGTKKHSTTDMKTIFALKAKQRHSPEDEKYNIKVLIQGYMHSTANFLRSDLAPNGLLFHTANVKKTKFCIYEIVSMDVETYQLSRTFLFRHHTLRTMRDILNRAAASGVFTNQCTPQWFINQYLSYHAYPSSRKWQRLNFLEGVESADEGSSLLASQSSPSDAQTHIPRHLRTVHKNELWSIFASHSEWILSLIENHKDLKGKVNSHSWRIFSMAISDLRQRALLDQDTGGRWGIKDEKYEELDQQSILSSPLSTKPTASQPISPKVKKEKKKKPIKQPVSVPDFSKTSLTSLSQSEDNQDNIYDSDFSQGSLSPSPPLINPSLLSLIPQEMFTAPTIPSDMLWHCPIGAGSCSYTINMCSPSAASLKSISTIISQQEATYLLKKQWKTNDEDIYQIFYEMVNAHWDNHLTELDIRHVHQGNNSYFEWIHPQRHAPWPSQKWKLMKARREQQLNSKPKLKSPEL